MPGQIFGWGGDLPVGTGAVLSGVRMLTVTVDNGEINAEGVNLSNRKTMSFLKSRKAKELLNFLL